MLRIKTSILLIALCCMAATATATKKTDGLTNAPINIFADYMK